MHDPPFVRSFECVGDLQRDVECVRNREQPIGEPVGQRWSLDQLEHQRTNAPGLFKSVNRGNVRVIQRGQQPGLTIEACQSIGIGDHVRRQHLDRHVAIQSSIAGPIDFTHSADSEQRHNLVWTDK